MLNLIPKNIPLQKRNIILDASALNDVTRVINNLKNMTFDPRIFSVTSFPTGTFITARIANIASAIDDKPTFRCTLAGNKVTVSAGTIRHHGLGKWRVEEKELTLTGQEDYVFVYYYRDGSQQGIDHMATEPNSDTNAVRVPLAKYRMTGASIFELVETCHKYDINFGNPLR